MTSSLYLGLSHPSRDLSRWDAYSSGLPAVLGESVGSRSLAGALAQLVGAERAVLARSTLHAFLDVFTVLGAGHRLLVDAGAYPVARWGLAATGSSGLPFAHHDPAALGRAVRQGRGPVLVLADGACAVCGRAAPVAAYLEASRRCGGLVVLDDSQALGLLGRRPDPAVPYGYGGGGSARHADVHDPRLVLVSSLAKAFGAPLAVTAGTDALVRRLAAHGPTRSHSSPPSTPDVLAGAHALHVNRLTGDRLRWTLLDLVRRLRARLTTAGLRLPAGGELPVQRMPTQPAADAVRAHERLLASGLRTFVQGAHAPGRAAVTVIVTAAHSVADIDFAAATLAATLRPHPARRPWGAVA